MSKESALAVASGTPPPPASPAPEAQAQAPAPLQAPEPISAKQFAYLAKKEAELVKQREEFKKERDSFGSEREKVQSAAKQYQDFLDLKGKDPVAAMKILGFSETDIFNYMAGAQPPELTPEEKAAHAAKEATDAAIKEFQDAQAKKEAEVQKQADDQLIQGYRNELASVVTKNPDKFEYCAHYGAVAQDLIYETVLAVVTQSNGQDVPTAEEAAQMVEEFYEEQDQAMSKLKKRQPKVQAAPPAAAAPPQKTRTLSQTQTLRPARTLTNQATVTAGSAKPVTHETFSQKRERLIEKLRNGG